MAPIRIPVMKYLVTAAVVGLLSLGAAGVAGAAGSTASPGTHKVNCTGVRADLTRMHRRQSDLSAKVAKLQASTFRAAKEGKGHRAAVIRRNLLHWQRIQAHKINARFLRRESKLAAQAAGQCQATAAATSTPATTAPASTAPAGSTPAGGVSA